MSICLVINEEYNCYVSKTMGDSTAAIASWTGKGYARHTPSAVKTFASTPAGGVVIPADARHAWIMVANNPIRCRTDGTNPTASEGLLLAAGTMIQVENQRQFLEQFRFIDTAAGASEVTIMYFS